MKTKHTPIPPLKFGSLEALEIRAADAEKEKWAIQKAWGTIDDYYDYYECGAVPFPRCLYLELPPLAPGLPFRVVVGSGEELIGLARLIPDAGDDWDDWEEE